MSSARANTVTVGMAAALLIPLIERMTGIKLTADQAAELVGVILAAFHAGASLLEKYFPPPNPTQAVEPPKVLQ